MKSDIYSIIEFVDDCDWDMGHETFVTFVLMMMVRVGSHLKKGCAVGEGLLSRGVCSPFC